MAIPYERRDDALLPPQPRLVRPKGGRYVAGVCAGVAEHLSLPVMWVRIGAVALAFAGGAGVAAYIFLWVLTPADGSGVVPVPARLGHGSVLGPTSPYAGRTSSSSSPHGPIDPAQPADFVADDSFGAGDSVDAGDSMGRSRSGERPARLLALGAIVVGAGLILGASQLGLDLRAGFLLPVLVIGAGAVIAWSQLDSAERSRWIGGDQGARGMALARVGLGVALAVIGLVILVTRGRSLTAVWDALLATAAVLLGATLIAAPWVIRLWSDLRAEQAATVRATERADIAAHLHDSVLQTLALIQRKADDPHTVTQLARAQERELRAWLYAGPAGSDSTLAAALTAAAHDVEDEHGAPIDLVVTGDRAIEPQGESLVRAFREALLNAVRHGRPPVTAYVEIGTAGVQAFVKDRGVGFDPETVPTDRLGVRQSILGRMERHGGTARVRRLDVGTEIELTLPPLPSTSASNQTAAPAGSPVDAARSFEKEPS
ncbi:MAG: PspC domain-containing protein [Nostocoides sp.]